MSAEVAQAIQVAMQALATAEAALGSVQAVQSEVNDIDARMADDLDQGGESDSIPSGIIVMWSGTTAPDGWKLCDGTNDTPDLRSRFIVGYNPSVSDYDNPGNFSEGGSSIGNVGGFKWHGVSENNHSDHELSHWHQFPELTEKTFSTCLANGSDSIWGMTADFVPACDAGGSGDVGGVGGWCGGAGAPDYTPPSAANRAKHDGPYPDESDPPNDYQNTDNRPPYYVLAFIMKT